MSDNQSIQEITARYAGRDLSISTRSDRYKAQWTTSPMATSSAVDLVDLTYTVARVALYKIIIAKLSETNREFKISDKAADRLKNILLNVTNDNTSRYNLQRGIYLFGPGSIGKTFIMRCIYDMLHKAYYSGRFSGIDIPHWYEYKALMLRARKEGHIGFLQDIFAEAKIIFIDDIGYAGDNQLNLFGNKDAVIVHLIDVLYRHYTKTNCKIYFTSNLEIADIERECGTLTSDRIIDMCSPVTWHSDINYRQINYVKR